MRIAVVGTGSMGRRRLRCLKYLGETEVAGMELSEARAAEVAQEFSLPVFGSWDELSQWGPEAVLISTPPDQHLPYALACARASIHFFTEASVVPEDTAELQRLSAEAGIVAAPSCTLRFHPGVRKMRELIDAGTIGRPLLATHHVGQYLPDWHPWEDYRTYYVSRRETGAAREIVPFELNWMSLLLGRVTEIAGCQDKLSDLEVDIDDVYAQVVRFDSGALATLVIEVISRPALRSARIVGSEGSLEWDWTERQVRHWRAGDEAWTVHEDPPPVPGPGGGWVSEEMYIAEVAGFLAAVRGDAAAYPFSLAEDRHLLGALAQTERSWQQRSWRTVETG